MFKKSFLVRLAVLLMCFVTCYGCLFNNFTRYKNSEADHGIALFKGRPPEDINYFTLGSVRGEHPMSKIGPKGQSQDFALQDLVGRAKAKGANGVIDLRVYNERNIVICEGEAVLFSTVPQEKDSWIVNLLEKIPFIN